jgi:hypothetical protein
MIEFPFRFALPVKVPTILEGDVGWSASDRSGVDLIGVGESSYLAALVAIKCGAGRFERSRRAY